ADIRARLEHGDEDSLVNFWLYGTSFTARPRATPAAMAALKRDEAEDLLIARLGDLVSGLAAPGANERLAFGRQVVGRHGIDPTTERGQEQAQIYLVQARERMAAETARYRKAADAANRNEDRAAKLAAY